MSRVCPVSPCASMLRTTRTTTSSPFISAPPLKRGSLQHANTSDHDDSRQWGTFGSCQRNDVPLTHKPQQLLTVLSAPTSHLTPPSSPHTTHYSLSLHLLYSAHPAEDVPCRRRLLVHRPRRVMQGSPVRLEDGSRCRLSLPFSPPLLCIAFPTSFHSLFVAHSSCIRRPCH